MTPVAIKFVKKPLIPFEQKVTFGLKTFTGFNAFGSVEGNILDLKPQFGAGLIANFKTSHHLSLRHELIFGYNRFIAGNVNYSVSYPWLLNYHFKHHAFVNMGLQPSLVFFENQNSKPLYGEEGHVYSAFELCGLVGVEYPLDENLDFGVRLVKSFNFLLKTDLPDYQGLLVSFTFYWNRFTSSERKLMNFKIKKRQKPSAYDSFN